tara:strand:- start:238 stop:972 length:735 start_codon:yes stop_codon:yes gene_type:complete
MNSTEILFVSIMLLILGGVAYWMKIPKAVGPLVIIYAIFLVYSRNQYTEQKKDEIYLQPSPVVVTNGSKPDKLLQQKKSNLVTAILPKPHVFDSETIVHAKNKFIISDEFQNTVKTPPVQIENAETNSAATIKLLDIQICLNVKNRVPLGGNISFSNDVDSLFCYTRLENFSGKQEVSHVWYYKNKLLDQIRYNVKSSNIYRSWTRKTILKPQVGAWRVDVENVDGHIIGTVSFSISDSEIPPQ